MWKWRGKSIRKWNVDLHRDVGYFFTSLIIAYCISGIALNHVDEWNPDFIINKQVIALPKVYTREEITPERIDSFSRLAGETSYKVFDFPTPDQVKIYYDNASLHIRLSEKTGSYERVTRRPLFYQVNVLHKNSLKGWNWAADIFAFMLIFINVSGLFIMKGKYGLKGRGKWLIAAGFLPPLIALIIQSIF